MRSWQRWTYKVLPAPMKWKKLSLTGMLKKWLRKASTW